MKPGRRRILKGIGALGSAGALGGGSAGFGLKTREASAVEGNGSAGFDAAEAGTAKRTPTWTTVPTITFVQGQAATISVAGYATDEDDDPLTFSKNGVALPAGVTFDAANKRFVYDGIGPAGGTDNHVLTADDGPVTVVEFYNASLDHYFITHVAGEIARLDNGTLKGWVRTGLSFKAFANARSGTSALCRIYIPPGKGDSHFFGRDANECVGTIARNPTFVLESGTFLYLYPPVLGTCPAGQVPIYRLFNNRADANHRYTTDRAVRDQMVRRGWVAEGDGPDTVAMCAPP